VCLTYLKDGTYDVRGTVRDPSNAAKLAPLKKAYGEELFAKIEIVAADLLDADSLDRAIAGCDYVVHTASPLPIKQPDDESVLIKPAVEGTLSVLRGALKHKVKRVVVTSSGLTVGMKKPENAKPKYNEDDWSDLEALMPYEKSKWLAEKAAWDFVQNLPAGSNLELVVCIPGLVQGPALIQSDFSSSNYMKTMMLGFLPAFPRISFPIVDVRDVAQGHLQAIKVVEAANKRIILIEGTHRWRDLSEHLRAHFGDVYPFKTEEMAECPPGNLRFQVMWEKRSEFDNSRSKTVLGIQYHDIKDTLVSMATQMIDDGVLPDNRKK
jgi:nucleoside-diphosphate-sugar epimerase